MNILDLKKRIIYITAALKNINIVSKNNHIKTDEELEMLVREAIHFTIGQDMTSEEKLFITEGIRSLVFETKPELLKTSSKLLFYTKPIEYVDIFENIKVNDRVDIESLRAPLIKSLDTLFIEDSVKMNEDTAKHIKDLQNIKVVDETSLARAKSIYMEHYAEMYVADEVTAAIANAIFDFVMRDKIFVEDKMTFAKALSNLLSITSSNIVDDSTRLDIVGSLRFTINSNFKTSSRLEFESYDRRIITIDDSMELFNEVVLEKINSTAIQIADKLKLTSKANIEISSIIPIHFTISSMFNVNDYIAINKILSKCFKIENKFSVSNGLIFSKLDSLKMKINNKIKVSNLAVVGTYTPAIIADYEYQTIGSFKNKEILDFKYIIK